MGTTKGRAEKLAWLRKNVSKYKTTKELLHAFALEFNSSIRLGEELMELLK